MVSFVTSDIQPILILVVQHNPEQGMKLHYDIWQNFNDYYGIFTIDYPNWDPILPLNNAPGTQELCRETDTMSEGSSSTPDSIHSDEYYDIVLSIFYSYAMHTRTLSHTCTIFQYSRGVSMCMPLYKFD
jgi:hypothetical protein